jgi:hypothetical protein
MMTVDVASGTALATSKPRVVWEGRYLAGAGSSCGMNGPTSANYDVSPDGQRFLMIRDTGPTIESKLLHVVSNWSRQLAPRATINSASSPRALQLKGLR